MRNQYKLLSEKYSTILEGGHDDPINTPEYYTSFVQKAIYADNIDDFEKILAEFAKQNYYRMNKFALYECVEQEVLKVFAGFVRTDAELKEIRESLDLAIYYMLMYVIRPDGKIFSAAKAKKSWEEWNYFCKSLRSAQKNLKQKNKETGINLDI